MAQQTDKRFENKHITEYNTKVQGTRWFLNRYFTPQWLQAPTKAGLIVSLLFWAVGIAFGLYVKYFSQNAATGGDNTFIDMMLLCSTITMAGMCLSFYRASKRKT